MSIVFAIADNLDLAWSNFDPFFTLPANCPYHVEREGKPLDRLKRALLRENRQLPKYFFSGHRGCGKSTELKAFFISFMGKIKSEDSTRKSIREKIEPKLSELIDKINMIISDIKGKEGKEVLVVICF